MSGENVSSVRDSLNQLKFPSASPYKLHPGCEMVLPTAVSEWGSSAMVNSYEESNDNNTDWDVVGCLVKEHSHCGPFN